jgi:hypothetical protein
MYTKYSADWVWHPLRRCLHLCSKQLCLLGLEPQVGVILGGHQLCNQQLMLMLELLR